MKELKVKQSLSIFLAIFYFIFLAIIAHFILPILLFWFYDFFLIPAFFWIIILIFSTQISILLLAFFLHKRYPSLSFDETCDKEIKIKKVWIWNISVVLSLALFTLSFGIVLSQLESIFSLLWGRIEVFYQSLHMISILIQKNFFLAILTIAVLPSFVEEFFFRGVLQRKLAYRYGKKLALLFSSFFFALMHLNPNVILALFFVGLFLGYTYEKTKSLSFPIFIHFTNNFSMLLFQRYEIIDVFRIEDIDKIQFIDMPTFLFFSFLTILSFFVLQKLFKKKQVLKWTKN